MNVNELEKHILPVLEAHGIARHRINVIAGKTPTLEIMIMKPDGTMDMDTCETVSRDISRLLDEIDYGNEAYNLDVCSFGAERELLNYQEVENEVNCYVHAELRNPREGLDMVEGKLLSVQDGKLEIEYFVKGRRKTAVIEYDNIRMIRQAVKL